jgi:hypothetical protein
MAINSSPPGQRSGLSVNPRDVLLSTLVLYVMGQIDSANAYDGGNTGFETEIRPGMILARITSSKKWVPVKRTTATSGVTGTALVVADARAFKVGETLMVGANAGCVISAINYSTNTITLSASKTWTNGAVVYCDSLAGSETARAVLNEHIVLRDEDGTVRDKNFSKAIYFGTIDNSQVLGDLAAIRADTGAFLGAIMWADRVGLV